MDLDSDDEEDGPKSRPWGGPPDERVADQPIYWSSPHAMSCTVETRTDEYLFNQKLIGEKETWRQSKLAGVALQEQLERNRKERERKQWKERQKAWKRQERSRKASEKMERQNKFTALQEQLARQARANLDLRPLPALPNSP